MKVSKWVDMGQEVEIEVGLDDVRVAMGEAFSTVIDDRLGEEGPNPNRNDVLRAINSVAIFLKALTDAQIALLGEHQRKIIGKFLSESAVRFG